jgi:hypothetical protein
MNDQDESKPAKKGINWGWIVFALLFLAYLAGRYANETPVT